MRATEFITEVINTDIMHRNFKHQQQIGDYTFKAKSVRFNQQKIVLLRISCYKGKEEIGYADFEIKGPGHGRGSDSRLESDMTWVSKDHRQEGIASTMYAYAKMLGNDIAPSSIQLPSGKKMWDAWEKTGDAEHLMREDSYQPPTLHTGDKILKGKFKNSPAEIKGFTKDKHNQPVLKTNKGDVQLFKPRVTKLVKESTGNTITLQQLYGGNYPDRDEIFWDYVNHGEFNIPLEIQTLPKHKVMITLLGQYRAEHIDEITDMLDDDQQEIVQAYVNDPALSSKVIVVAGNRIIDGNHRALAAAIRGVPINYVDLADLEDRDDEEELTEYEHGTSNSKKIFAKLQSLGYEKLGSGQDSTVWAKDENHVIKILMPSRTIPGPAQDAERGFLTFYSFCKDRPELPNLPKFIDIGGEHHTVFELDGVPYRQIAMEKLQPIKNGSFEEAMVWILSDLANIRAPWNNVVSMLKKPDTWGDDPKMASMPELVTEKLADPAVYKQYGILYQTMSRLYHLGLKNGLGWDLHTENVMQRRDGTLVIVDPYFT